MDTEAYKECADFIGSLTPAQRVAASEAFLNRIEKYQSRINELENKLKENDAAIEEHLDHKECMEGLLSQARCHIESFQNGLTGCLPKCEIVSEQCEKWLDNYYYHFKNKRK